MPHEEHWDHFWRHTHAAGSAQGAGAQDPALGRFWHTVFTTHGKAGGSLLDLASGDGAVTGFAVHAASRPYHHLALDYSSSALMELRAKYPDCHCVVADAGAPPFLEQSLDLVCSQFGAEYAGEDALLEAGNLVGPGGKLVLVIHMHGGAIYKECKQSLRAITEIQRSQLLPTARGAFQAAYAARAGHAGSNEALGAYTAAMRGLEQQLGRLGADVATGLPRQIYVDLRQMYANLSAYAPEDIYSWIDRMIVEVEAFRGRMTSMNRAAMDRRSFDALVARFSSRGLKPRIRREIKFNSGRAGAWSLLVERI